MGVQWEEALFIDIALLSGALKLFRAIADTADGIVKATGEHLILHYLGDFL